MKEFLMKPGAAGLLDLGMTRYRKGDKVERGFCRPGGLEQIGSHPGEVSKWEKR